MIKFKLIDENNIDKNGWCLEYPIILNFENLDDFFNFQYNDKDFEDFMNFMESGKNKQNEIPWWGIHDGGAGTDDDGIEYISFSSYEIEDFNTSIEKWKLFFKGKNKLL